MRIALLSTLDGHASGRAAFADFAGAPLIQRQLEMALALGCETVACMVDAMAGETLALQHHAERAGVRFLALREVRPLSGLVSAADEILVIDAGVLPDEAALQRHLARPAILAFPADPAVALGYERIDGEFAWSGVLLARGSVVEGLADVAPDADVPSALLRIALQTGTRVYPLEVRLLDEASWHRNPTAEQLAARAERWIRGHSAPAPFSAPGLAVADRIGAQLAVALLGSSAARIPWLAAALSATIAVALAVFEWAGVGVGFVALAAFFAAVGSTIDRIARAGSPGVRRGPWQTGAMWLTDPLLIGLVAVASPEDSGWLRLFVPAMLIGLLQLGERVAPEPRRATYRDRIAVGALLAVPALFGFAQSASAVLALLVLISLFVAERGDG